ncbi:MAG: SMC-Scp complex subunit ScpB [Anaerolineales bacterium]
MNDATLNQESYSLTGLVEALLFVSPQPLTVIQLSNVLGVEVEQITKSLEELDLEYRKSNPPRYIRLQKLHNRYQLTTDAEIARFVEKLLGLDTSGRLSQAALETLAVIAYRQPITRPQIDAIRGVNSDGVLNTLLRKGLIQELGRSEAPGRPILYAVTAEFLQYFGLNSVEELPHWDENQENLPKA